MLCLTNAPGESPETGFDSQPYRRYRYRFDGWGTRNHYYPGAFIQLRTRLAPWIVEWTGSAVALGTSSGCNATPAQSRGHVSLAALHKNPIGSQRNTGSDARCSIQDTLLKTLSSSLC
jgi:hypothetical protein